MTSPLTHQVEFDDAESIALARLDVERGDLAQALARLKNVLAGTEPPVAAVSMAARLYAQLGLLEHAQKQFQQLMDKNQYDDLDLFQLGMTYFEQGQTDTALDLWDQVLAKQPHYPPALYYRALALLEQNRMHEGRGQLEQIIQVIQPDNLYFERAKSLLGQLRNNDMSRYTGTEAYANTEH